MGFIQFLRVSKYIRIIKRAFTSFTVSVFLIIVTLYSFLLLKWHLTVHPNFASVKVSDSLSTVTVTSAPPVKTIFFHETSGKGKVDSRQTCAVESAAKAHPKWQINLLFLGSYFDKNIDMRSVKTLAKYSNINFFGLDVMEYAAGTPLESMFREGKLNQSRWRVSHTSDALRYLSLYKWGGVYLDLDVIVAKSFEDLAPNWGARESKTAVAAGAISFSLDKLGREVAEAAIKDFKDNFKGNIWGHNGPGVMTRILKKMCGTNNVANMSASNCKGFEVYGPELFYPISWRRAKDYFSSKKKVKAQPYMYHIWNRHTMKYKVNKTSLYAQLARKYCPEIYKAYNKQFGT